MHYLFYKLLCLNFVVLGLYVDVVSANTHSDQKIYGDWVFMRSGESCLAGVESTHLQSSFWAYSDRYIVQWVEAKNLHNVTKPVHLVFDDGTKILWDQHLSITAKKENQINLGFMTEELFLILKQKSEFSIEQNNRVLAGPFSLEGSSKALNAVRNCHLDEGLF